VTHRTSEEAVRQDVATVTSDGAPLATLPDGVRFRDAVTHIDDRGTLCELFDERWDWHEDPLVYSYVYTVRPGRTKGWAMHKRHEDRYFVLAGSLEVVLYDEREDSPTRGVVATVVLSEHRRRLMNIPAGVWHANRNIGEGDAMVVNFPTIPYDHADPDKYLLPLDTDRIPHRWPDQRGW
jgi:dTDP-4-dehydrorhamnose 3,5-epimerase